MRVRWVLIFLLLAGLCNAQTIQIRRGGRVAHGTGTPSGYTDNFNRSDDTTLGANWTIAFGGLQIATNAVTGSLGDGNEAFYSAGTFTANQYSQATITGVSGTTYRAVGVIVRASANRTFYYAAFEPFDGHLYIGKWVYGLHGDSTYSANEEWDAGVIAFAVGEVIRLEVTGQDGAISLVTKRNGTQVDIRGDINGNAYGYINSGKAGCSVYGDGTTNRIDNWAGGDL